MYSSVEEVAASALKVVVDASDQSNNKTKQRRSKHNNKHSNSTYSKLTTRQKSITRGRDPIISLNMNLDYLAKSGQKDACLRAEQMLMRIEALHKDGYYEKSPDVISYNSVINAYAQSGIKGGGFKDPSVHAERLMSQMVDKGLKPNTITYNTLLRCILKEVGSKQSKQYVEKKIDQAEGIIAIMEKKGLANTISYNTVISIISKSNLQDAAERAELWLQHMKELYVSTSNIKIQPDACSFNSVIHAHSNSNNLNNNSSPTQGAKRAEQLLSEMISLHRSGKYENVKPDVVSYSAVVNAYARAAKAGRGSEQCADRAMEILDKMVEVYEDGDVNVKPNKMTYTAVRSFNYSISMLACYSPNQLHWYLILSSGD